MITVTKGGNTATIDEDLTIASNNETLRQELQDEVEFATYGDVTALPVLLVLYQNLKSNPNYEAVEIEQEVLDALKGGNDDAETIF